MTTRSILAAASVVVAGACLHLSAFQSTMGIDELRPGMIGVGRTVFTGDQIEEFKASILGVLRNAVGPKRNLILARLEGGPLANTGVIQGMSGSPVYIDGRLIGAVSYALGSFPREPIAGITPIAEMTRDVDAPGPRARSQDLAMTSPATPASAFAALERLVQRASAPLGPWTASLDPSSTSLGALASGLRPIGATMVLGGFDPEIEAPLRHALGQSDSTPQTQARQMPAADQPLRPGDPVGVSLIRGDLEMGATGTVTYVDGSRLYAFGHPFLNLGPTSFAMTRARVIAVLPSLDSSLKIAALGPVVGALSQDRSAAVGGLLGAPPVETEVNISLSSTQGGDHSFKFLVAQDPALTPLFTYVAVLNALSSYERQVGLLSIEATGTVSFGRDGQVSIDDVFSGDGAVSNATAAVTQSVNAAALNEFHAVLPDRMDLRLHTSEQQRSASIERAWLDTAEPKFGGTYSLHVVLHNFRGATETVTMPVTMPAQASGPVSLLVCDGSTLTGLEQRELAAPKPASLADVLAQFSAIRHNNRLYVRLLGASSGVSLAGQSLPNLPASVQAVLETDKSAAQAPLGRAVLGAWDQRFDRAIRGSREIPITLSSR